MTHMHLETHDSRALGPRAQRTLNTPEAFRGQDGCGEGGKESCAEGIGRGQLKRDLAASAGYTKIRIASARCRSVSKALVNDYSQNIIKKSIQLPPSIFSPAAAVN